MKTHRPVIRNSALHVRDRQIDQQCDRNNASFAHSQNHPTRHGGLAAMTALILYFGIESSKGDAGHSRKDGSLDKERGLSVEFKAGRGNACPTHKQTRRWARPQLFRFAYSRNMLGFLRHSSLRQRIASSIEETGKDLLDRPFRPTGFRGGCAIERNLIPKEIPYPTAPQTEMNPPSFDHRR